MINSNPTNQEKRLKDFARRTDVDPSSVAKVEDKNWEYIAVHPLADEAALLRRLGIKAGACIQVDCYWRVLNDVVFLQVYANNYSSSRGAGIYARWSSGEIPMLYLSAFTRKEQFPADSRNSDVEDC